MSVPFGERGGALRGLTDAVCGRLPRFIAGAGVPPGMLPVFHFHDVTNAELEPKLRYLAENGYRTVTSDEIAAHARGQRTLAGGYVALCFDDAWASLWTVAKPLLERYGMTAVTYAIPARIEDAAGCRQGPGGAGPPFVTWPELKALHASGLVDVQSHTETHSMVSSSSTVSGFVTPEYAAMPMLNRPQVAPLPQLRFLEPDALGAPLYTPRSRMSDARRVDAGADVTEACTAYVRREGGADFFERLDWEERLNDVVRSHQVRGIDTETDASRERAIVDELDHALSSLSDRLRTNTVRHICLPWGVSCETTVTAMKRVGYQSAFANRMDGTFAVQPGDDPFWLKRLPNRYIFHLPGRGRRIWI